jgi:hypothetical protein
VCSGLRGPQTGCLALLAYFGRLFVHCRHELLVALDLSRVESLFLRVARMRE